MPILPTDTYRHNLLRNEPRHALPRTDVRTIKVHADWRPGTKVVSDILWRWQRKAAVVLLGRRLRVVQRRDRAPLVLLHLVVLLLSKSLVVVVVWGLIKTAAQPS